MRNLEAIFFVGRSFFISNTRSVTKAQIYQQKGFLKVSKSNVIILTSISRKKKILAKSKWLEHNMIRVIISTLHGKKTCRHSKSFLNISFIPAKQMLAALLILCFLVAKAILQKCAIFSLKIWQVQCSKWHFNWNRHGY